MWPFIRTRAEPEQEKTETESNEEALLRASLSDDSITKEQAMNVPTFASCVNLITETISTIPIRLYRRNADEVDEMKDDVRPGLINADTLDTLDGVQFKRALVKDYLLGQGGYAYINRLGNHVESLHYVKENELSFMYAPDPIFKDYDIMIQGRKYKPYDFLKVLRNTEDGRSGKGVVGENSEVIKVAHHSLAYEKNLVKTGGNKKGFIKSPRRLEKEAMKALKDAWRRLYQNNAENVVILNDGLEFKEASNTSVELQLNENKRTNGDEICKIFNVPPAMINGKATEEDKSNFIQYCINPILEAFACALNRDLLLESEKGSCFFAADTSELTKGDIEKRFKAYELASKNGFMQIDEIRFKENMPPLGLDFVKLGLQDVLYKPETEQFYTPNMNQIGSFKGAGSQAEKKEGEEINED